MNIFQMNRYNKKYKFPFFVNCHMKRKGYEQFREDDTSESLEEDGLFDGFREVPPDNPNPENNGVEILYINTRSNPNGGRVSEGSGSGVVVEILQLLARMN